MLNKLLAVFFVVVVIYVIMLLAVEAMDAEAQRYSAGGKYAYCSAIDEYNRTQHLPIEQQRGIKPYLHGIDCMEVITHE